MATPSGVLPVSKRLRMTEADRAEPQNFGSASDLAGVMSYIPHVEKHGWEKVAVLPYSLEQLLARGNVPKPMQD